MQHSTAATIPAGTVLVVRTLQALSSVDARGTHVPFALVNDVRAGGRVALAAGTRANGRVITARRTVSSSERLSVDLISVQVGNRTVTVRTTGALQVDNNSFRTTRHNIPVSRANFTIAAGRQMRFPLAQAVNL